MDDSEHVCPLCCEELDISDRQFFPCKCGYQVCMWCWHRIRESESGLCPACRTPYGDDPHEFSAVDVEEVLKANKEKEAAAKKERQRQNSDGGSSDGEGIGALIGGNLKGQMEVPKDRTQLANMRVIRRNLVYAVGLPSSIASEDTLRKAEYFGQYGKISKIVLNRSQTTGGDPRRASASAYVTFVHKEDTLSCILALDGFYLEGRNIRASYGTSKYCSAFIKNVRCNNPECTYLHQMGDVEDTFTKQEIQAGYVTSGRDVLARQQQIVQQALSAASGAAGSAPRRKTGGGGPSGTGRAAATPVFPPPTYDEPAKPSTANLVPPPPGRAVSTGAAFPPISAANPPSVPAPTPMGRVVSAGATPTAAFTGPTPKGSIVSATQAVRKSSIGAPGLSGPPGATAASVVAGVHSISGNSEPPAPHTTLTPLTPLKRASAKGGAKADTAVDLKSMNQAAGTNMTTKLTSLRSTGKKNGAKLGVNSSIAHGEPLGTKNKERADGVSLIGGSVIAAPPPPVPPPVLSSAGNTLPSGPGGLVGLGGGDGLSGLGGEVFNGPLKSSSHNCAIGGGVAIGSNKDKWNSNPIGGDPVISVNPGGLWSHTGGSIGPSQGLGPGNASQVGGNVIGGGTIGGYNSGSSALASMLGINLPTGSGTLRENTNLWGDSNHPRQAPIASLNGSSMPLQGVIGPGHSHNSSSGLIGGVTIGGGSAPIGSGSIGNGGNKSDIALLQSLLPGVHITSGGSYGQGNGLGTIGGGNGNPNIGDPQHSQQWNGGFQGSLGGQPVGAIGQHGGKQNQRQAPGSIW